MQMLKVFSLALVILLCYCQKPTNSESSDQTNYLKSLSSFPKLLDRNPALQNGKEWEQVQRNYVRSRNAGINGDPESKWKVAQIFVQEARITGEHGHYYPAALQLLDEILASDLGDEDLLFRALTSKAGVLLSQHEFNQALDVAQTAYQINSYNAAICGVMVDAYVELGNYPKAVEMADKMVSIRPDMRSYSRISYLREIFGDMEGAIEAMRLALKSGYPGYEETAWTQLELGNLYFKKGDLDAATKNYQEILSYRPDYPFAIAALADVQIEQKQFEEAEKLLKKACKVIPEVGFYEQLAMIYQQTSQRDIYNKTMGEIWTMLEDDVQSGHNMNLEYAQIHLELTADYEQALAFANAEYQKRPNNIDTNRLLAKIYHQKGNSALADSYEQKVAKILNWSDSNRPSEKI